MPETLKLQENYEANIRRTAEIIKGGGLVLFPSDTVYILAVDPTNQMAADKLLAFKDRWAGKAISVAVTEINMAKNYVDLTENAETIYTNLLPGPFTVVSAGKHKMAKGIEAENGTLGVRIPDNKFIFDLVTCLGRPVTATSANLSGRTPNYSVTSFLRPLSKKKLEMLDLLVDAGKLPHNKPSTVIDATNPEIKILRRGDLITGSSETLLSKSEKETEKVAEFLLQKTLGKNDLRPLVFGLSGDLGCGKTVFSRRIGHALGVKSKITSPTFVIYNEYEVNPSPTLPLTGQGVRTKKFLHFDLYRLGNKFEFEEIHFLEQFSLGTVACIEWPENMGEEYLRKLMATTNYVPINFRYVDATTREIRFPQKTS